MKLASLLAEYLYTHKRLDLPGIGSFLLDPAAAGVMESSKQARTVEGISFENNPGIKETPELIQFIASSTGKIKALASADLDSHLELARQFLNIGKPFLFEGIGSLSRIPGAGFSFMPGAMIPEKVKDHVTKEAATAPESQEDTVTGFKNIFYGKKAKTSKRKSLVILLLLAGLALALWGGYTIYKKTIAKSNNNKVEEKEEEPQQLPASDIPATPKDSVIAVPPSTVPAGNYKFVVETADKARAIYRHTRLKAFGLPVQMETSDSISFRIYFLLAASPADTTRLLDSLQRLYTPAGGKAYVQ